MRDFFCLYAEGERTRKVSANANTAVKSHGEAEGFTCVLQHREIHSLRFRFTLDSLVFLLIDCFASSDCFVPRNFDFDFSLSSHPKRAFKKGCNTGGPRRRGVPRAGSGFIGRSSREDSALVSFTLSRDKMKMFLALENSEKALQSFTIESAPLLKCFFI